MRTGSSSHCFSLFLSFSPLPSSSSSSSASLIPVLSISPLLLIVVLALSRTCRGLCFSALSSYLAHTAIIPLLKLSLLSELDERSKSAICERLSRLWAYFRRLSFLFKLNWICIDLGLILSAIESICSDFAPPFHPSSWWINQSSVSFSPTYFFPLARPVLTHLVSQDCEECSPVYLRHF